MLRDDVFLRKTNKYVGTDQGLFEVTSIGINSVGGFPLVHSFFAAAIDNAAAVAHNDIFIWNTDSLYQLDTGDGRGACAVYNEFCIGIFPTCQMQSVD